LTSLCPIDFQLFRLRNNSALAVAVNSEAYLTWGDIQISTLITKVVANLRRS